ncbi:hypothetical protein ABB37_06174 [Leptomonas pyrrhocoris]|uniref:Uncharacterized protein n=1 Tax=Leptomonas pyrrhocoris TaxID=157538 RepID=A0A0N1J4M9_LEPPY|nr:hypothetical protein ABB37_06174 [Leptomonas pyrrhocoris]KPA78574.1 hypothetical protein ABB37_06174 [Leptomonas pyrrhocoris]|eukprot:XP_015657013.1 hypothetical protein ABB37_06174 [Leptomonas pyrrhocoris]
MNSSSTHAGPPFSPHDAAAGNGVVFKKQVLKLGLDGSSLPRLVVVTEKNVYVCLPSGGITRTIAVACIERITLSPREDMVSGDASDATDVAPPSSPNKAKKEPSRSPGSFFASVFSRGRGGAKDSEKKSASRSRHRYEEDVDETHPASPKSAAPPTQQPGPSAALSSSDQQSSTGVSPAEWAVIATLGIASEAPLALQLLRVEDGVDFVAALRASPHISASAVFNVPDEDGPTNAMGELLFAPPARRADPIVPRVLERDADEKEGVTQKKPGSDVAENTAVDEVELSPSSPRSTNVASPPPMTVSADVEVPSLRVRNAGRVAVRDAVNGKNNNYNAEEIAEKLRSGGARGQEAGALHTREHASSHSSPPSSRSPPPSSKASSVHTAEEVVTLTPVHAPTRPSPDATPQMQQQQQSQKAKEPPAAAATRGKSHRDILYSRTLTCRRAAPSRCTSAHTGWQVRGGVEHSVDAKGNHGGGGASLTHSADAAQLSRNGRVVPAHLRVFNWWVRRQALRGP